MYMRSTTPDRQYGTEPEEKSAHHFKRPLTSMKSSLQKLTEIGTQINDIISKWKSTRYQQNSNYSRHLKKSSVQISHNYLENRGGTETERSHLYYKIQKESIANNIENRRQDRSQNIQKYITNKILRNRSWIWSSDNKLNQCSLENSRSENITSRNNRMKQSSYIKTPTKNNKNDMSKQLSPRIVTSKIYSLLQSMTQELDYYTLSSSPIHIQNDPNQTHLVVCCKNYKLFSLNQYSRTVTYIGQHHRPIKSMTKIIIQSSKKTFYTSSIDGQIIQWTSDSMHGIFKYQQSIRVEEPPLQLYLDSQGSLYILTANYLMYQNYKISLFGCVKCLTFSPTQIYVAIDNQIIQINKNSFIQKMKLDKQIKTLVYEDEQLYILTASGTLIVLDDKLNNLCFNSEIELEADCIYAMHKNQIIIQKDSEIIIYSSQRSRSFQIKAKITCLLPLSQQLLVGNTEKTIQIIKL